MKCDACHVEADSVKPFFPPLCRQMMLCGDCRTEVASKDLYTEDTHEKIRAQIRRVWESTHRMMLEQLFFLIPTEEGKFRHREDEQRLCECLFQAIIAWDRQQPEANRKFGVNTQSVLVEKNGHPVIRITRMGNFQVFDLVILKNMGGRFDHRLVQWRLLRTICETVGLLR